jgi:glycine/sarcosine N-methyltransferase
MGIYGHIAPHYDALFPVSEVQARFVAEQLRAAKAKRVLDAGCGSGRHMELLSEAGFTMTGLEPDPGMAELARRRLGGRALVVVAGLEAADQVLEGPFNAALCLGNTLAHLVSPGDLAKGLAAMAALLAPGGLLITQTVNFDKVLAEGMAPFVPKTVPDGRGGELLFERGYDFEEAPERLGFQLSLRGAGIDLAETLPLLALTRARQSEDLTAAGFELVDALGDWTGAAWSEATPATILCARRRVT